MFAGKGEGWPAMGGTTSNRITIALGLMTVLVGSIPLLAMAGVLPRASEPADPAPSWMGWLIGAMFVGAGLIVTARGVLQVSDASGDFPQSAPRWLRLANRVIGFGIACGLAIMFTWVAFGPGPRHFSIGLNGVWLRGFGSGERLGRVAFGFGAILTWVFIGAVTVRAVRNARR